MSPLILYTTSGCHLCELAQQLLIQCHYDEIFTIKLTEIAEDDHLLAQYGTRIPVIKYPDGSELNWPFDADDLTQKRVGYTS